MASRPGLRALPLLCAAARAGGRAQAWPLAAGAQCPRFPPPADKIAQALFAQSLLAAGTPWHSRLQMKHPVVRKLLLTVHFPVVAKRLLVGSVGPFRQGAVVYRRATRSLQ
jgi:hypothetical protein